MLRWPPCSSSMNCSGYYRQEYLKEYLSQHLQNYNLEIEIVVLNMLLSLS